MIRRLIHIGLSWVYNATDPVEGQGLPIKEGSKVIQNTSPHGFPFLIAFHAHYKTTLIPCK